MKRVLISDPKPRLLRAYCTALRRAGYATQGTTDGIQCLARLAKFRPHLLVLEVDLPQVGAEGILACMGQGAIPEPLVILLGREVVRRPLLCCEERISARFNKPLLGRRLTRAVSDCLNTAASRDQPGPRKEEGGLGGGALSGGPGRQWQGGPGPIVLLVEDDPMNRKLMRDILEIQFVVVEAASAEAAWEVLEQITPHLILLDVALPGQDGLSFKDQLATRPELAGVPVVAVSANAMPHQVEEGGRHGFAEYITKPILEDPVAFAERLARLCGGAPGDPG